MVFDLRYPFQHNVIHVLVLSLWFRCSLCIIFTIDRQLDTNDNWIHKSQGEKCVRPVILESNYVNVAGCSCQ